MIEQIAFKTLNKYIILDVTLDIFPVVSNLSVVIFVYTIYNCINNSITDMLLNE